MSNNALLNVLSILSFTDFMTDIIFEETNMIGAESNVPSTMLVPICKYIIGSDNSSSSDLHKYSDVQIVSTWIGIK